jgi:hypothetical protein
VYNKTVNIHFAKGEIKMKKIICLALVLIMTLSFVACEKEDINKKSEGVMTWEEYNAAALNDEVTIEAYVQGKQGWWSDNGVGKATIYLQDGVGGYLLYDLHCSEEEYGKLVEGTKVRVTGYKAAYKGEYEIIDATFEIIEGSYVAPATDITSKLGTADILNCQNMKVAFKGLTVVGFEYQGGARGKDIYVTFSYNGANYSFCVESYLTGADSDLYKAVEALKAGDVVDVEGFAYWYDSAYDAETNVVNPNAINTHITGITVK